MLELIKSHIPPEAEADSSHEFWGRSPDVQARNFADPVRHVVHLLSQKGDSEEYRRIVKVWSQAEAARKEALDKEPRTRSFASEAIEIEIQDETE